MRIYLASSWRNKYQPEVLKQLREAGYETYDFRNPEPGNTGFAWTQINENYQNWTREVYRKALHDTLAQEGFQRDKRAMYAANVCVLLLPCGRSAHLEAGYFVGAKKPLIILMMEENFEPELMYKFGYITLSIQETINLLKEIA